MLGGDKNLLDVLQFLHKQMGQWCTSVIPLILSYKTITALFRPLYSIESSYLVVQTPHHHCRLALMHSFCLSPCCPPSGHFQVLRSISIPGPPCSVQPCSCRGTVRLQPAFAGSTLCSIYCSRSRAKLQNKCPLLLVSSNERVS